jgi:copper(I)-binding protein
MNRRTVLKIIPGALAMTAASPGLMVPALGADAKSANGTIEIQGAWARATTARDTTAYLDIVNHGTNADRLVAVHSPLAEKCTLQNTRWRGLTVKAVAMVGIAIPAMARVTLKPGGMYVQLVGLVGSVGDRRDLPLSLTFAEAGEVDVTAALTVRMLGPTR